MRHPTFNQISWFLALTLIGCLGVAWFWLDDRALIFKEDHVIEVLSVALLGFAVCLWFMLADRLALREWQIPVVLALMAGRELDFDKRFLSDGILKLRTYTGDTPLSTKLIGGAVVLFVLVVAGRILWRNAPVWWQRIRLMRMDSVLVLSAFVIGVVAKGLDGLARKLEPLGIHVPPQMDMAAGQTEEVFELICYVLVCLAIARLAVPCVRREARLETVPNGQVAEG